MDYLEVVSEVLKWNKYSFKQIDSPWRHTLANVGRYRSFPANKELKDGIAKTYSSVEGTTQCFDVYCITSYNKLDHYLEIT